jgi:hypothetical protein
MGRSVHRYRGVCLCLSFLAQGLYLRGRKTLLSVLFRTYERFAANEGARSFTYESTRERTPLGHAHREQIREMYRQAVNRLLSEVAETEEFFRAGIVAIDITEADPFTGDRTGHEDEIIGTKEKADEYAYQQATVQLAVVQALSPYSQRVPQSAPADKERSRVGRQRRHHPLRQRYSYYPNAHQW